MPDLSVLEVNGVAYDLRDPTKAPAGYGLGLEDSPEISDANQAIANGWYRCSQNVANVPPVWHNGGWIFVESYNSIYKKQTYTHEVHGSFIATRIMTNGSWHEWEFVNPPMVLGVEYRTTERLQGKAVYVMAVDCGTLPNKSYKNVNTTIPLTALHVDTSLRIRFEDGGGITDGNGSVICYLSHSGTSTHKYVHVETTDDRSMQTAVAYVKYVKN